MKLPEIGDWLLFNGRARYYGTYHTCRQRAPSDWKQLTDEWEFIFYVTTTEEIRTSYGTYNTPNLVFYVPSKGVFIKFFVEHFPKMGDQFKYYNPSGS